MNKGKNSNGAGVSTEDCIFCKIIDKKIPAEIVYENDTILAFLDINPVNEGHTLIIPKDHYPQMTDVPSETLGEIFGYAKEMMSKIKEAVNADFVALTVVGTDVSHFHIHLVPRMNNDGLAGFWPTKKYESDEKKKEVGEKIRRQLEKKG